MQRKPHVLIITLDSCRWDSFQAGAEKLMRWGTFRRAFSQGTYTLPAHLSIYHGILPNTHERVPYYNRFEKNIFRISGRPNADVKSLVTFPPQVKNIFNGFNLLGYETFGIGAVEWFKREMLTSPFEEFVYTGIDLKSQIDLLGDKLHGGTKPVATLLNVGETHDPYEFGRKISPSLNSRERMRLTFADGFLESEYAKQVAACSWIATELDALFSELQQDKRPTLVIICGDHGECFGEDGMHGHGFYHPMVMTVPLGIFCIGEKLENLSDFQCNIVPNFDVVP